MIGSILYSLPTAPLIFPEKLEESHKLRNRFLSVVYGVAFIYCAKMPSCDLVYHMTIIFFDVDFGDRF